MSLLTLPRARPVSLVLLTLALALAAASLAACAGSNPSPPRHGPAAASPSQTSDPLALGDCTLPPGTRPVSMPSSGGTLTVYLMGTGPSAVVLSNESDQDLCSWLPFAASLVDAGDTVAVSNPLAPVSDIATITDYLRARGARTIALMGASMGAKASLVDAVRIRPPVDALVSLSAEQALTSYPQINLMQVAQQDRVASLFVTAKGDEFGAATFTPRYYRAAPAVRKRLLDVPGTDHGTALLGEPAVSHAVLTFLRGALSTPSQ